MVLIVSKNYVINNFRHFGSGSCSRCGSRGGGGCCGGGCCGCGGGCCWWDVAGAVCPNFGDCCRFQGSFA